MKTLCKGFNKKSNRNKKTKKTKVGSSETLRYQDLLIKKRGVPTNKI